MLAQSGPLPNPETPLAFLPKSTAYQYEVSRHVYLATIGAFIWDILTHLPEEWKLLFSYKITLPTVVYFISRIASLAFITTSTVFQISTVHSCHDLQVAIGWCLCLAISSTSFLFFLRARAIFDRRTLPVAVFFTSWLGVFGSTLIVPFAIDGEHIGTTQYCINTAVKPFSSAAIAISSINDALVLVAVSWRITISMTSEETFRGRVNVLLGRGGLPALSQAVLQAGQQYYFITVGSNILTLVMIIIPTIPPVYHAIFTVPNVALMNSMGCRVFRKIKFGTILASPGLIADPGPLPMSHKRGGTSENEGFQPRMGPINCIEIAGAVESCA